MLAVRMKGREREGQGSDLASGIQVSGSHLYIAELGGIREGEQGIWDAESSR